jgi:hypothetical protein
MRIPNSARALASGVAILAALVLVGAPAASAQPRPAAKSKPAPAGSCCTVTAIDRTAGVIMLKVLATGVTCTVTTGDRTALRRFAVGDQLAFQAGAPTGATGNAASGTGGPTSGSGSSCGSNVGRNADTRPKDCVATNSAGQQVRVACPTGVPIKTATP